MGSLFLWRDTGSSRPLTELECDALFAGMYRDVTTLTISAGNVALGTVGTSVHGWYRIDTEAASAADDITGFTGGKVGDEVLLMSVSNARQPTIQHGGIIFLANGQFFTLETTRCALRLKLSLANEWTEMPGGRVYIP